MGPKGAFDFTMHDVDFKTIFVAANRKANE